MEPDIKHELIPLPKEKPKEVSPESAGKYLLSFFWMIVFTAIAFILVEGQYLTTTATVWVITILAAIQVVLQLFTFMHLDLKTYRLPVIFMGIGLLIAVVSVVGIILM